MSGAVANRSSQRLLLQKMGKRFPLRKQTASSRNRSRNTAGVQSPFSQTLALQSFPYMTSKKFLFFYPLCPQNPLSSSIILGYVLLPLSADVIYGSPLTLRCDWGSPGDPDTPLDRSLTSFLSPSELFKSNIRACPTFPRTCNLGAV